MMPKTVMVPFTYTGNTILCVHSITDLIAAVYEAEGCRSVVSLVKDTTE